MRLMQGQLASLLADPDLVVLLVGRGDLSELLRRPDLTALHDAGGSSGPAPRRGTSSWLVQGGRVVTRRAQARQETLACLGAAAGVAAAAAPIAAAQSDFDRYGG